MNTIDLQESSFQFAHKITELAREVAGSDTIMQRLADRLFSAATSIGVAIEKAQASATRKEMVATYSDALNSAQETLYWLRLLDATKPGLTAMEHFKTEAHQFHALLSAIIKKLKH